MASNAAATPILWTLHDVSFYGGGTAVGSFIHEQVPYSVGVVTVVNIVTTSDSEFAGTNYTGTPADGVDPWAVNFWNVKGAPIGRYQFGLQLLAAMTAAGGRIDLRVPSGPPDNSTNSHEVCWSGNCAGSVVRQISSGYLVGTPVPVPAAGWLFAAGLAVLTALSRRRL